MRKIAVPSNLNMRFWLKQVLLTCTLLTTIGFVSGCKGAPEKQENSSNIQRTSVLLSPQVQETEKRSLKPPPSDLVRIVTLEEPNAFWDVRELHVDDQKNIYAFDRGDMKVKVISEEDQLIKEIGQGQGRGPGEFISPGNFSISEGGYAWFADRIEYRISIFDTTGALAHTLRVDDKPLQVVALTDSTAVIMEMMTDQLFKTITWNGEASHAFGVFIEHQATEGISTVGSLMADGKGGFVYLAFYAGRIARFKADGTVVFYTETIDKLPFAPVLKAQGGFMLDPKAPKTTNFPLNVFGDEIHVIGHSSEQPGTYIDTYNLADGSYLYSTEIPDPDAACAPRFMTDEYVYTACPEVIKIWRRK